MSRDSLADQLIALGEEFSNNGPASLDALTAENIQAPAPPSPGRTPSVGGPSSPPTATQLLASLGGQQLGGMPGYAFLQDGSITADQIGDGEVGSDQIADLAILEGKLADNSVTQAALQDSAVSTEKIATGAVTALKIGAGEITADLISAVGLGAEQITSGTLSVGGLDGAPTAIQIYDQDGALVGIFDESGVLLKDPQNTQNQVRFKDGALEFSADGGVTWDTALNANGLIANSVLVGTAQGGHNAIPNSSFEVRPFATIVSVLWTLAADWAATVTAISANINVDVSTGDLKLTTVTY